MAGDYSFLSPLEIEQAEYLYVRGVPISAIAEELGRSQATISKHLIPEARGRYRERLFERCREECQAK